MLTVQADGLSAVDLEKIVALYCSRVGPVKHVTIHQADERGQPFAVVEMSTREQTYMVAARFGDSAIGDYAVIRLEQQNGVAAVR
jgi:hypothetical protein